MRHVPVSAYALHLVRQYIEGDRRMLVAAYDAEDSGTFSSPSLRVILAVPSLLVHLTKSWNG